jgi:hypothetical protein
LMLAKPGKFSEINKGVKARLRLGKPQHRMVFL